MAELVGLPVEAGSADVLVVEVDEQGLGSGLVLASAPGPARGIARAQVSVAEALDRLKPSLQKVAALLKELSPEEAEVEFGLKVGGETGVIVARGTAEVNFVVRLTWRAERPGPAQPG